MKQLLFLFSSITLLVAANAQASDGPYQQCTSLAASDPIKAQSMAEDWLRKEENRSARHCLALALYAGKHFHEAAVMLQKLGDKVTPDQPALGLSIMQQSATAYQQAEEKPQALTMLNKAVQVASDKGTQAQQVEVLVARAKLYEDMKRTLDGVQDLDNAHAIAPQNTAVLIERAKLFKALGMEKRAQADIAAAGN